ncbi:MAG: CBS domain-containing protein [Candidatus Rokubacteria bacterium]|nr:CBS domain-containing protein [Candidatus Rokubacteria bacterium]
MAHPKRSIPREIRTRRPLHPGRGADELEALTWPEKAILVADRMSRPAATIRWDAPAREAAGLMRSRKIRHLPVVDAGDRLVGIVTDRDLRQAIFDANLRERLGEAAATAEEIPVREVMTWGAITVHPRTEIREAARLMHARKLGALPVVEGHRVVGILSESDVLRTFLDLLNTQAFSKPYRWALGYR